MASNGKFGIGPGTAFFKRDREFLELLKETVSNNHPHPDFDLHMLSVQMEASERQIQRKLKTLLGCSPSEYVRTYRLNQSLYLLQQGTTIGEAARAVGFKSQSYFASCFKAQFGQTPSAYQHRVQRAGT